MRARPESAPLARAALALSATLLAACGSGEPSAPPGAEDSASTLAGLGLRSEGDGPLVAFLGDSLTAGLNLSRDEAFPALVHDRLEAEGLPLRVINAGISGDSVAGGRARLDWLLDQDPDVVFVALGVNDAFRTRPLDEIRADLRAIVERVRERGAYPILAGQRVTPNYGPDYTEAFAALYADLAAELDVAFLPFLLQGVGGVPGLNLADGIHPNARGHQRIADLVVPVVRRALALLGD